MPATRITLATPALLFSAISLLMLAFTNRFLALAALVRNLHAAYKERPDETPSTARSGTSAPGSTSSAGCRSSGSQACCCASSACP